jgi:hypothetical protein
LRTEDDSLRSRLLARLDSDSLREHINRDEFPARFEFTTAAQAMYVIQGISSGRFRPLNYTPMKYKLLSPTHGLGHKYAEGFPRRANQVLL